MPRQRRLFVVQCGGGRGVAANLVHDFRSFSLFSGHDIGGVVIRPLASIDMGYIQCVSTDTAAAAFVVQCGGERGRQLTLCTISILFLLFSGHDIGGVVIRPLASIDGLRRP